MVLISGAAGGIGSATAELFKSAGWSVIGVDKRAANITGIDHFFDLDVSDPASVSELFSQVARLTDKVDALVNNAAAQICKSLLETSSDEWDEIMATNARSAFLMTKGVYPLMKHAGGSIVNVSSVHALATSTNIAAYAASKGALLALTRASALELAPNIRVNAVLPGAIDTPMLAEGLGHGQSAVSGEDALIKQLADRHPVQRIGKPNEVAEAIFYLADNARSSFVTGQSLVVDGGAIARLSTE